VEAGDYVPDSITVAMLKERIAEDDAAGGFILDGFPRTIAQVEALDELIGEDGLDKVVLFRVDNDVLVERMLARGRADDNEETIRNRLKVYEEQTAPLIDLYRERGVLVEVDGVGEIDEITERVIAALGAD
jgi:Adenylate kinase (EC 2.7.4.3)